MHRRLVLDTCALLWLASGSKNLSAAALKAVDKADMVLVSAITAWEIGIKVAKNALELPLPSDEWFRRALDQHGLILADLSLDILNYANKLPWHHRDPADRFIIATAMMEQCPVVTRDRHFHKYDIEILG